MQQDNWNYGKYLHLWGDEIELYVYAITAKTMLLLQGVRCGTALISHYTQHNPAFAIFVNLMGNYLCAQLRRLLKIVISKVQYILFNLGFLF